MTPVLVNGKEFKTDNDEVDLFQASEGSLTVVFASSV